MTPDTFTSVEMSKEVQDIVFEKNKATSVEYYNQLKQLKMKKEEPPKQTENIDKFMASVPTQIHMEKLISDLCNSNCP